MEPSVYEVKEMDKYDYIEIIYRFFLFCIICVASGYILVTNWIASTLATGDGIIQYIVVVAGIAGWLVIILGIAAYLVFVAKGSFRPKEPSDDEEDDGGDDDE